jgi:hypothetical protein
MDYFVLMTKHGVINVKRVCIVNGVGRAIIAHLRWELCNMDMGLGVIEIISYVLHMFSIILQSIKHIWRLF